MAQVGEILYEEYFHKLKGSRKNSTIFHTNPWRLRYFILRKWGDKPVLEYYVKKPKKKTATPKDRVFLWPRFKVEKITNLKNRAYVFELTTPDKYLCLSATEQKQMDIFVFLIQSQMRLIDQLQDDLFIVQPENSESQRRIGAKTNNCYLQVSPWGVTLALKSTRSLLAQWPLKSIRSFESSGNGQFSLEAGRVAPLGEGQYIFNTRNGEDNHMYDLIDRHVLDNLEQLKPDCRGTDEEFMRYQQESDKLQALTVVEATSFTRGEFPQILKDIWSFIVPTEDEWSPSKSSEISIELKRHTSENSLLSSQSDFSQRSDVPPPLPTRGYPTSSSTSHINHLHQHSDNAFWNKSNGVRLSPGQSFDGGPISQGGSYLHTTSPQLSNSSRSSSLTTPPSLSHLHSQGQPKSRSGSVPGQQNEAYLHSTSPQKHDDRKGFMTRQSTSSNTSDLSSRSPSYSQWDRPPSYSKTYAFSSQPPLNDGQDGYLVPSQTTRRQSKGKHFKSSSFEGVPEVPHHKRKDMYLLENNTPDKDAGRERLHSVSCEDLSDYMKKSLYDSQEKLEDKVDDCDKVPLREKPPDPFPELHNFRGSTEWDLQRNRSHSIDYYNTRARGGVVSSSLETRSTRESPDKFPLRRTLSNPNFINVLHKKRLSDLRSKSSSKSSLSDIENHHPKSHSLVNLLADGLRRHLSHEKLPSGTQTPESVRRTSGNSGSDAASNSQGSPSLGLRSAEHFNIPKKPRSFRKPGNQKNLPVIPSKPPAVPRDRNKKPPKLPKKPSPQVARLETFC